MSASSSPNNRSNASPKPTPIRKLDETVINRIAAGEIINRPSNALKELIENSLDAGSTSIAIGVKDGGMKVLQIQDNGHGIRTEDMPIVCERFTTSKLKTYEDLSTIQTYGFRGEALASISHVSHLSITTKQADSDCAYKANYADGKIVPARPGGSVDPEPCAGNNGTVITAEDLFYNIPSRKSALKNTREEYNRIFEVASRYSIHNAGVAFTCRKIGTPKADLNTQRGATTIANIRQIFGAKVANSLVAVSHTDEHLDYEFKGHVSSSTHEMHKSIFLLFINHRLVDHTPIKRAVESLYTSILPKASRPFVYLDLQIKPQNVDVNVHPTKREVRFLNEDTIVGAIIDCIHRKLLDANESRSFPIQSTLVKEYPNSTLARDASPALSSSFSKDPPLMPVANRARHGEEKNTYIPELSHSSSSVQQNSQPKTPINRTVRTDYKTRSLESFSFGISPSVNRNRTQLTIGADFSVSPSKEVEQQHQPLISSLQSSYDPKSPETNMSDTLLGSPNRRENSSNISSHHAAVSTSPLAANTSPLSKTLLTPESSTLDPTAQSSDIASTEPGKRPRLVDPSDRQMSSDFPEIKSGPLGRSRVADIAEAFVDVQYASIRNLRNELKRHTHAELTRVLSEHTFVGFVDDRRALLQYQTRLYMVDYCKISYHLFYHRFVFDFMNFGRILLQPAPSIYELALIAAQELGNEDPEKAAEEVNTRFVSNSEMLEEFFLIRVSDAGAIESLPMVVKEYSPDYDKLPLFLYSATFSVDWENEQPFLKSFINALATLYTLEPPLPDDPQNDKEAYRMVTEHRIFPSFKESSFWAPNMLLTENAVVQLADLPDLYRIFERC
ncbi:DNA mismatch repair protein [Coemansia sp. RSA 1813]|nr:DNA mismatch repair protein Mlh1 [Coemansia sp. RSA 1646]KAJ1771325.1 DNA mismatch repair protein [Coemansia sp. RSA 1843]KAJ2088979.1 DNA mismatch repair protein [Coemansia sp. RSA 986]KAJ2213213.1 DNA mismatch repair protein [Coemansia sp. RSA 487]KAJ2569479.1 DNA mismatch repair protein [Coemansia sp. RSA 1813]